MFNKSYTYFLIAALTFASVMPSARAEESSFMAKTLFGLLGVGSACTLGKIIYNKWYVIDTIEHKFAKAALERKILNPLEIAQDEVILENYLNWRLPLSNTFENDLVDLFHDFYTRKNYPSTWNPITNFMNWLSEENKSVHEVILAAQVNQNFYEFINGNLSWRVSRLVTGNVNYANAARAYWKLQNYKYALGLTDAVTVEKAKLQPA